METLYGRFQVADSSDTYAPYDPSSGKPIMDQPCVRYRSRGACMSRLGHRAGAPGQYEVNPMPEESPYLQSVPDEDVKPKALTNTEQRPAYNQTVGAAGYDMSRGNLMMLPSGGDMPVVRRVCFFDTRFRDIRTTVDATRVMFMLDRPLDSVSRIAVHSARVPIKIDERYNPGLVAEDYVMLSIGMPLPDTVAPINQPLQPMTVHKPAGDPENPGTYHSPAQPVVVPVVPHVVPTFNRALAYIPLIPMKDQSLFAEIPPDTPPFKWYVDFLKPMPTLDRVELSWWRFQKYPSDGANPRPIEYVIHNTGTPDYGAVDDNAYVTLVFFCKARRPE